MKLWEYKIIHVSDDKVKSIDGIKSGFFAEKNEIHEVLSSLGDEGWEAFSTVSGKISSVWKILLKREKS